MEKKKFLLTHQELIKISRNCLRVPLDPQQEQRVGVMQNIRREDRKESEEGE